MSNTPLDTLTTIVEMFERLTPRQRMIVLQSLDFLYCDTCGLMNAARYVERMLISRTQCDHLEVPRGIIESQAFYRRLDSDVKRTALVVRNDYPPEGVR